MIENVIIPCAGRGTRMLSVTHGRPKELLPLGGVPILQHVLHECASSGIASALIVVSPRKMAIVDFGASLAGRDGMPRSIQFAVQPEPRGLADAIRHGSSFAANGPFAVALPDNIFVGQQPAVAQVAAAFGETGKNVVGMIQVSIAEAALRGATPVYAGIRERDLFRIEQIPEKGAHSATFDTLGAKSAFTGVGRFVFTQEVFAAIEEAEHGLAPGAELDDVPVMQVLLAGDRLVGRVLLTRFLDVGLPQGYAEAELAMAGLSDGSAA